jgi:hypothetical protein
MLVTASHTADEGTWLARLSAVAAQARLRCGIGKLGRGIDYTDEDVHFMKALDCYKRRHQRPFPTCCEVLEVLRSLGYTK